MIFAFLFIERGIGFTIIVASLGLFFFSVMPIITAATMDQVERGSEGSATALIFAGRLPSSAPSHPSSPARSTKPTTSKASSSTAAPSPSSAPP